MRQKRAKSYRKQMSYYHINFKFRAPYQVIFDDEIILEALRTKTDLVKAVERTVQDQIKPMITQCCMEALYRSRSQDAIAVAKSFERRRCNHRPSTKPQQDGESEVSTSLPTPTECIKSIVDIKGHNKHRYVVATQKQKLRAHLRRIPAVPLIYINRSVMILEPMSPVTERSRLAIENDKLSGGLNDPNAAVRKRDNEEADEEVQRPRKKRGPSQPNPLSVKKKKTGETGETGEITDGTNNESNEEKKKRKRSHQRLL